MHSTSHGALAQIKRLKQLPKVGIVRDVVNKRMYDDCFAEYHKPDDGRWHTSQVRMCKVGHTASTTTNEI